MLAVRNMPTRVFRLFPSFLEQFSVEINYIPAPISPHLSSCLLMMSSGAFCCFVCQEPSNEIKSVEKTQKEGSLKLSEMLIERKKWEEKLV